MAVETGTYISDFDPTKPNGATDPVSEGDDHINIIKLWIQNTFPNIDGEVLPSVAELNYLVGVTSDIQTQIDALSGGGPGSGVTGDFTVTNGSYLGVQQAATEEKIEMYNEINGGWRLTNTAGGEFSLRNVTSTGSPDTLIMRQNGSLIEFYDTFSAVLSASIGPFGVITDNGKGVYSDGTLTANGTFNCNGTMYLDPPSTASNYIRYGSVTGGGNGVRINGNGSFIDFQSTGDIWVSASATLSVQGGIITWGGDVDLQGGSILNQSDRRKKENIKDLENGLAVVERLAPVTFDYIDGPKDKVGFIAQELKELMPNSVVEDGDGYLSVALMDVIPVLVKAVQELTDRVKELEGK